MSGASEVLIRAGESAANGADIWASGQSLAQGMSMDISTAADVFQFIGAVSSQLGSPPLAVASNLTSLQVNALLAAQAANAHDYTTMGTAILGMSSNIANIAALSGAPQMRVLAIALSAATYVFKEHAAISTAISSAVDSAFDASSLAYNGAGASSNGQLVVNQYNTSAGEFVSVELIDRYGFNYGEVAKIEGAISNEYLMPEVVVRVTGSIDNPASIDWPSMGVIDINALTPISQSSISLSQSQFSNAFGFLNSSSSFNGNTVDFASMVLSSIGQSQYSVSNYLANGSTLDTYAESVAYFSGARGDAMESEAWLPGYMGSVMDSILGYGNIYSPSSNSSVGFCPAAYDVISIYNALPPSLLNLSIHKSDIDNFENQYAEFGSPIAVDLNGDGIQTLSIGSARVAFDVTGDGVMERTGWLSGDDGFVAYDANGNNTIDGVNELFGGQEHGQGYAKLAKFDSNGDGFVAQDDADFGLLSIWQDANGNGQTDTGELRSLNEVGIDKLSLDYVSYDVMNNNNLISEHSSATLNGNAIEMGDIYFQYDARINLAPAVTGASNFSPTSLDQQLDGLIQCMASFSPSTACNTSLPPAFQTALAPVLAANPL